MAILEDYLRDEILDPSQNLELDDLVSKTIDLFTEHRVCETLGWIEQSNHMPVEVRKMLRATRIWFALQECRESRNARDYVAVVLNLLNLHADGKALPFYTKEEVLLVQKKFRQ